MIVETIKWVKGIVSKKFLLNYVSLILTTLISFSALNAFAAECIDPSQLPKLDVVAGYQAESQLTKSATGDPSYNSQTTSMNVLYGIANGTLQNAAPQTLSTYEAIKANPDIPEFAKGGALGMAENATVAMFNNFNGVNIPNYLASEWVPGYQANTSIYAADDGYSYLQETNIDSLWDRIRLISYVFFVVVLIAAGFMIMFRQKIGGQLAVSVFNVLPNVIIALILVTFSFAIVGLVINFGVMMVNVISSVLGVSADQAVTVDSPFSLLGSLFGGLGSGISTVGITSLGAIAVGAAIAIVTGAVSGLAAPLLLIGIFVALAIVAIVLYASVRVYITILTAYLVIILNTILAPLYLTVSAFPGQGHLAMDWFYRILKSVLTFPLVFFFLNLGAFILSCEINIAFPSGFMTGDISNIAGGGDSLVGVFLKAMVVIVLFFFAADAPKMLDDFLPTNTGKGTLEAIGGMKKGLSSIPLVGSFFK